MRAGKFAIINSGIAVFISENYTGGIRFRRKMVIVEDGYIGRWFCRE